MSFDKAALPERLKIMIAIPSRDVWKSKFGMSFATMMMATVNECNFLDFIMNNTVGAALAMARNELCAKARAAKCDYVLFLDDDMYVPMQTLMVMLRAQKDIIAANCPRKEMPIAPTAKDFDGSLIYTTAKSTGLQAVKSVGTGIMLIKTSVFDKIKEPWFFEDAEKRIGEDVNFCYAARAAGFKIFIDHDLSKEVRHVGDFDFTHQHCKEWDEQ